MWDGWVSPGNTPCRACVEAKLASDKYGVEIMVEALKVPCKQIAYNAGAEVRLQPPNARLLPAWERAAPLRPAAEPRRAPGPAGCAPPDSCPNGGKREKILEERSEKAYI